MMLLVTIVVKAIMNAAVPQGIAAIDTHSIIDDDDDEDGDDKEDNVNCFNCLLLFFFFFFFQDDGCECY